MKGFARSVFHGGPEVLGDSRALRAGLLDTPDDLLTLEFGPTVSRETPETTHAGDGHGR